MLTDVLLQAVVDPLDDGLLMLTLASQKTWNASSEIITTCNFRNDLHDICSKQKSQKTAYIYMYKLQQTLNSEQSETPSSSEHFQLFQAIVFLTIVLQISLSLVTFMSFVIAISPGSLNM